MYTTMNSSPQKTFHCTVDGVSMPIRAGGVMLYRVSRSLVIKSRPLLYLSLLNAVIF
jgi:hypothetical protein